MGLDRPAPERYLDWLGGLLTGDLGNSSAGYAQGGEISIWDDIKGPLRNSFILAAITAADHGAALALLRSALRAARGPR